MAFSPALATHVLRGFGVAGLLAGACHVYAQVLIGRHRKLQESFRAKLETKLDPEDKEAGSLGDIGRRIDIKEHQTPFGMFTYSPGGHILKYRHDRTISHFVLLFWKHTVICIPALSRRVMLVLAIAFGVFLSMTAGLVLDLAWSNIHLEDLGRVGSVFNGFIAILLGLYINSILARWWDLRCNTIGSLWGSVDDLVLLLAAHLPGPQFRAIRTLVLRYAIVSFELMFMQAQGTDWDLAPLVNRRLLREDERAALEGLPSKGQVVWTWIASIFQGLHAKGHISDIMLNLLYNKCCSARGGIGATFAYLDTQLPFMYVHLLACIVHMTNLIAAIDVGMSAAQYVTVPHVVGAARPLTTAKLLTLCLQTCFYNACLEIGRIFSNPLDQDFEDFPRHAYHAFMRAECEAFDRAAQLSTRAIGDALATAGPGPVAAPAAEADMPDTCGNRAV